MKTIVGAKVVLFRDDNKTLMLRRSKSMPYRPGELDTAGGIVDKGEDFIAAAVREVGEEVGLQLNPASVQLVFAESGLRNETPTTWLFFVAKVEDTGFKLSHEHESGEWMELDEALDAMEDERHKRLLEYIKLHQLIP